MARRTRRPGLGPCGHRFDESIPSPRHRLDVARAGGLVAKDRSESADDDVKAVVKVHVPIGPQLALDLLTSDQLAGLVQEQTEQVEGLSAEPDPLPSSPEAPSPAVKFEVSERLHHGRTHSESIAVQILHA